MSTDRLRAPKSEPSGAVMCVCVWYFAHIWFPRHPHTPLQVWLPLGHAYTSVQSRQKPVKVHVSIQVSTGSRGQNLTLALILMHEYE